MNNTREKKIQPSDLIFHQDDTVPFASIVLKFANNGLLISARGNHK